jgi:hypothetical protein
MTCDRKTPTRAFPYVRVRARWASVVGFEHGFASYAGTSRNEGGHGSGMRGQSEDGREVFEEANPGRPRTKALASSDVKTPRRLASTAQVPGPKAGRA